MASITKRGKYWRAQVRRRGYPTQFRTFDTKALAEAWARQLESEMDRGVCKSREEAERTTFAEALERYIRAKMEFSRRYPLASRIFAMEIISGGECLTAHFNQDYRSWFRGRAAVFEAWIAAGRMDPRNGVA